MDLQDKATTVAFTVGGIALLVGIIIIIALLFVWNIIIGAIGVAIILIIGGAIALGMALE